MKESEIQNWKETRKIGKNKYILYYGLKDFIIIAFCLYGGWFLSILWSNDWNLNDAINIAFLDNKVVHITFLSFSFIFSLIRRNNTWEKLEEIFKLKK